MCWSYEHIRETAHNKVFLKNILFCRFEHHKFHLVPLYWREVLHSRYLQNWASHTKRTRWLNSIFGWTPFGVCGVEYPKETWPTVRTVHWGRRDVQKSWAWASQSRRLCWCSGSLNIKVFSNYFKALWTGLWPVHIQTRTRHCKESR